MPSGSRGRREDLLLRFIGMSSVVCGVLALRYLAEGMPAEPGHQADLRELILAVIGVVACGLGSGLAFLGAHIHDEIEIAERWRRQHIEQPRFHRRRADPLALNSADPRKGYLPSTAAGSSNRV